MKWVIGFLIVSFVLSILIGKSMAYGLGSDLENQDK
jgi:hypothetical protein